MGTESKEKKGSWMDFYNGKIPKQVKQKPKAKKKTRPKKVHECHFCSNKSNEGSGEWRPDVGVGGAWVCAPCIKSHGLVGHFTDDVENDNFERLSSLEIMEMEQRQKNKNFWIVMFGILLMAIILSLVERSRLFSVIAVVALIAVFLLYRYEVRI